MARLLAGTAVERTDVAKNGAGTLVLTGAAQVLAAANKDRVSLIITHQGAGTLHIGLGVNPTVAAGIRLAAATANQLPFVLEGYTGEVRVIGTNLEIVSFVEI